MLNAVLPLLDQFDPICFHFEIDGQNSYSIYQRKGMRNHLIFETQNLNELDRAELPLYSKDQQIPVFHHVIDSRIRQKFVSIPSIDEDEIQDIIQSRLAAWFGQSRIRQAKMISNRISSADNETQMRVLLIPNSSERPTYPEPFTYAKTIYQGIDFPSTDSSFFTFQNVLFFSHSTGYYDAITLTDDSQDVILNTIDEHLQRFKHETGAESTGDIQFISEDRIHLSDSIHTQIEKETPYFKSVLSESDSNTAGLKYLQKQRGLKLVLAHGLLFLMLFLGSEATSLLYKWMGDRHENQIIAMSQELKSIQDVQAHIGVNTYKFNELKKLIQNRSNMSSKIHSISAFYNRTIFLKSMEYSDDKMILTGFARNTDAYTAFTQQLQSNDNISLNPISQFEMKQPDLKRKENLYESSLIHYVLEVTLHER